MELRVHLTFVFLLIFVLLTEWAARGGINPERSFALVGIIFGSVRSARTGSFPGRFAFWHSGEGNRAAADRRGDVARRNPPAPRTQRWELEAGYPDRLSGAAGQPDDRISCEQYLARGVPGDSALGEALGVFRKFAAQPGVGQHLACAAQPVAGLSVGWGTGVASAVLAQTGSGASHSQSGLDRPNFCHTF